MPSLSIESWEQPFFNADSAVPIFINGVEMTATFTSFDAETEDEAAYVATLGGGFVHHLTLNDPEDPLSNDESTFELTIQTTSEDQRFLVESAPALGKRNRLEIWVDRPVTEQWVATGAQTVFVLSRAFFYATGPSFADRPAKVFVDQVEQTVVDGTPGAGQFGIDQSANGNLLTAGSIQAGDALVQLRYYPLMRCSAAFSENKTGLNKGEMTLAVTERAPVRAYS